MYREYAIPRDPAPITSTLTGFISAIVHPPRLGDKDSGSAGVVLFLSRLNAVFADESRSRRRK